MVLNTVASITPGHNVRSEDRLYVVQNGRLVDSSLSSKRSTTPCRLGSLRAEESRIPPKDLKDLAHLLLFSG